LIDEDMCRPNWPQRWVYLPRHREAKAEDWAASNTVLWTGLPNAQAQYDPNLYGRNAQRAAQEQLELDCVNLGIIIKNTGKKIKFYRKMDHIVGACSGERTCYVYAEWLMSGEIHGRPASEKWLRQTQKVQP